MTYRPLGWKPSLPDHRDYKYEPPSAGILLPEVDPRGAKEMPVVYDQGQLGSCTGNAVAACLQYHLGLRLGHRAKRPSRLDIYYGERSLEGTLGQGDTGAMGRDGFKFAQKTGYLLESDWPYDISTFEGPPPMGTRHKLTQSYAAVAQDKTAIQTALSNNQTVAFGFSVYDSFEYQTTFDSGIVPMPSKSESQLGGHEVLAVGYLASHPNHVLVRNSWSADLYLGLPGADVHGGGYFLFPWQYLTNPDLSGDLRTIVI